MRLSTNLQKEIMNYYLINPRDQEKGVLSREEQKVSRCVFYEEWEGKRPHCLHCGKQLSARFNQVLVQVQDPTPERVETKLNGWGEEVEEIVEADDGIRSRSDFNDLIGFGWEDNAQFCTGKCAQYYARRAVKVLKKLGRRIIPLNRMILKSKGAE